MQAYGVGTCRSFASEDMAHASIVCFQRRDDESDSVCMQHHLNQIWRVSCWCTSEQQYERLRASSILWHHSTCFRVKASMNSYLSLINSWMTHNRIPIAKDHHVHTAYVKYVELCSSLPSHSSPVWWSISVESQTDPRASVVNCLGVRLSAYIWSPVETANMASTWACCLSHNLEKVWWQFWVHE